VYVALQDHPELQDEMDFLAYQVIITFSYVIRQQVNANTDTACDVGLPPIRLYGH